MKIWWSRPQRQRCSAPVCPPGKPRSPRLESSGGRAENGGGARIVGAADRRPEPAGRADCATCHSERGKAGGLSLASFDAAKIDQHPEVAEKMIRKLRAGMMPPPTAQASRCGDADRVRRRARGADRRGGRAAPEPGLAAVPAPEPRRISARGQGPARHRCRRHRLPAARHDQPGLRQRRRRAELLADADGRLPARGEPDQPPRDWRSQRERRPR